MSSRSQRLMRKLEKNELEFKLLQNFKALNELREDDYTSLELHLQLLDDSDWHANSAGDRFAFLLACWASKRKIALSHLTQLLKIINRVVGPVVPLDARTVLGTPQTGDQRLVYLELENGTQVVIMGIEEGLKRVFRQGLKLNTDRTFQLATFFDGFSPVARSKFSCVLHRVFNAQSNGHLIFASAFARGTLENPNGLFKPLVEELQILHSEGCVIGGVNYKMRGGGPFIMDFLARTAALFCKQSGYDSCLRCVVPGVSGPSVLLVGFNYDLKTDEIFRTHSYKNQLGKSVLEEWPETDLVQDFPHEAMHLVFLGVVKRIFLFWTKKENPRRLTKRQRDCVASKWDRVEQLKPNDFRWRSDGFASCLSWKAKTCRFWLLYAGFEILQGIVSKEEYEIHCTLAVAVRLLTDDLRGREPHWVDKARDLIDNFRVLVQQWFGEDFVSMVPHHLGHLEADVRRFGPLEEFSAFPFEAFIGSLGSSLNGPRLPLQQMARRYVESGLCTENEPPGAQLESDKLEFKIKGSTITTKFPNNVVALKNGNVFEVHDVGPSNVFVGKCFLREEDLFVSPVPSSKVGIKVVRERSSELLRVRPEDIYRKCYPSVLQDGGILSIVMLHEQ